MFWLVVFIGGIEEAWIEADHQTALGCALEAEMSERVVRSKPLSKPSEMVDIVCVWQEAEPGA